MNRIYRSIWNDKTGTFVAASEHAKSDGSKSPLGITAVAVGARFAMKGLAVSLMLAFGSNVYALPTGGAVSAGSASIAGGAGKLTISQSSQNVAINWLSFSIAPGEAVQFVQPNSSSVALNRVLGSDPSSILGSLSANGKVFLMNPNGILFGQGAQVNVGGLVASTVGISDSDFMAGKYNFSGAGTGTILNQGSINADGGYVALLGANVSNEGVISAKLGTVALAAGNAVTLDMAGDGLLNVTVNQGAVNALIQNGGLIRANGGQVLMTAQAAGNLLNTVVNNTGIIEAQTVENHNGTIRLMGDMQSGTVNVGGTLDTSGTGTGQTGGSVTVTGQHVGLFGGNINASGDAGGGTVLVGGDLHGANAAVQNASATYMSADSAITADALTNGSGGKVVLWANNSTRAYGSITSRGGSQGGDGGVIETSGHWLDVAGINVNASAPNGKCGTWLLDPADVTITDAASSPSFSGGDPNVFSPGSGAASANVNVTDIITALATTGVTINTTNTGASGIGAGNITVAATVTPLDWTATTTLILNADNNVNVNGAITAINGSFVANAIGGDVNVNAATKTTTGNLTFTAKNDVNIAAATTVITGNLTSTAGHDVNMTAASTVTTGNITSIAAHDVNVSAAMTVTTGDMVLRADNDGTGPGAIVGGTVAITCGLNCLTITTGNLRIRFNPASYGTTGAEITAYGSHLTGGGVLDAKAWVFGKGDNKMYDGTTTATVSGLKPDILSVAPPVALGAVSNANFDTKNVGTNKLITFDSIFSDPVFDLFAPFGTAAGTYTTRADILVRPLTVTAATDTRVYNGTTSSVGIPTSAGLQPGDTLNGAFTQAYTSKDVLGAGNSTLVANGAYTVTDGNGGNNYTVTVNTAPGTITPAPLTIQANDNTKVYGQTFTPASTAFTLPVPPIAGETVTSVDETSTGTPPTASVAGSTYPIVITPGSATGTFTASNYTITYLDGALNVTPAPLTVTADDATKVYGQTFTPASTAFTTTALQNSETVGSVTEVSPAGTPPTAAVPGPYAITPSAATGGTFTPSNYTINYVNGALLVTPAPLTVTANDTTKTGGTTLTFAGTEFTNTATQNGETVGNVSLVSAGTPAAATAATYPILPTSATGGTFTPSNYTINYVNGVLTVTPAPLPLVPPVPVVVPAGTSPGQPAVNSSPSIQNSVGPVFGGLAGLNLAVIDTGVRMPPIQLADVSPVIVPPELPPVQPVPVIVPPETPPVQPVPVIVPPETPPKIYVPPPRLRKQDRN